MAFLTKISAITKSRKRRKRVEKTTLKKRMILNWKQSSTSWLADRPSQNTEKEYLLEKFGPHPASTSHLEYSLSCKESKINAFNSSTSQKQPRVQNRQRKGWIFCSLKTESKLVSWWWSNSQLTPEKVTVWVYGG